MPYPCGRIGPLPHLPPHEINVPVQAKSGVSVHFTLRLCTKHKTRKKTDSIVVKPQMRTTASAQLHVSPAKHKHLQRKRTIDYPQVPSGVHVYSNLGSVLQCTRQVLGQRLFRPRREVFFLNQNFTCRDFGFRKNSAGLPFHGNAKHYPSDCIICFRSSGFWYGLVRFCCSQISSLSHTWRVICVQCNIELCSAVLVFPAAASMIVNLQLVLVSRLCSAVWLCLAFIKGHSLRVEPQEAMHDQHIATWAYMGHIAMILSAQLIGLRVGIGMYWLSS